MSRKRPLRGGIYLMPTLFTVGNLLCGFSSMILAARGEFGSAAVLIILAGVLDGLDGRIARLTGSTSEFGLQFDSLADAVSFGVAPAMLAYHWTLEPLDRVGWLVAFVFVVCAAMRLARFNIQASRGDKRWFAGLPSPAAAGIVASVAFAFPGAAQTGWTSALRAILIAAVGLLMISRFRYRSFKDLDLRNRRSYIYVLPMAMLLVAIAIQPRFSLLGVSAVYGISGPAAYLVASLRRQLATDHGETADEPLSR